MNLGRPMKRISQFLVNIKPIINNNEYLIREMKKYLDNKIIFCHLLFDSLLGHHSDYNKFLIVSLT